MSKGNAQKKSNRFHTEDERMNNLNNQNNNQNASNYNNSKSNFKNNNLANARLRANGGNFKTESGNFESPGGWRRNTNDLESHVRKDMNVFSLSQFGERPEETDREKLAAALAIRNTDNVKEKFKIATDELMKEEPPETAWIPDPGSPVDPNASRGVFYQRHTKGDAYSLAPGMGPSSKHLTLENFPSHPDSLHRALKPVLILARCFALLPVEGISAPNASYLAFNWNSLPCIYLGLVIGYSVLIALLSIWKTVQFGISYYSTVDFVFVTSSMVIYLLFLQLATLWPKTMCQWEKAEHGMRHYGYPKRMALKFRFILFVMMALAIIEHVASIVTAVFEALPCSSGGWDIVRAYFVTKFRQVFTFVPFNICIALPVLVMNLILTCAWNFMDVFIILMSFAMAERYKQVNERLNSVKCKVLPTSFWRHIRETYNTLSCLTKLLDNLLSPIVLLSFANNLYFICLQLLNSLRPMQSTWQATYFVYSFSYLLVRTIAVSLFAASVHDQSKEPKSVLFSVPTESYCVEVSRFLIQVTNDDLALTGCKFFAVTRTFMLTVAGTIVTYEIVLVQFNAVSSEDAAAAKNSSIICP
nr:PREDICTED: gustatory receptor 5a for trehalose-like [Bemisia tabaci]